MQAADYFFYSTAHIIAWHMRHWHLGEITVELMKVYVSRVRVVTKCGSAVIEDPIEQFDKTFRFLLLVCNITKNS